MIYFLFFLGGVVVTILAVILAFRYGLPDDGGESLRKKLKEDRIKKNFEYQQLREKDPSLPPAIFR